MTKILHNAKIYSVEIEKTLLVASSSYFMGDSIFTHNTATSSVNQAIRVISSGGSSNYGINIGVNSSLISPGLGDACIVSRNQGSSFEKYGYYLDVIGNGISNTNYGYYANISGALNSNVGKFIGISGTYGLSNRGILINISSTGQSFIYGHDILINTDETTQYSYGVNSRVNGSGISNIAVQGVVGGVPGFTSQDIAGRFIVKSGTSSLDKIGVSVDNEGGGTTSNKTTIKLYNAASVTTGFINGIDNGLLANSLLGNRGIYNQVTGTHGTSYAIYNNMNGYSSTNNSFGVFNLIQGYDQIYGVFNQISGTFGSAKYGTYTSIISGGTKFGEYISMSGTDTSYGSLILLTGTGSSNIGLDITVSGASTNNAIVVNRGNSIFNENGENWDFRIEGDTEQNLLFVDASSDNIGIGTDTPNTKALVDMSSTTKGFLPPRMTTSEREAISSPPAGLLIFNTTTGKHEGYTGTTWSAFY